jgi:hypothetical protein
MGHRVRFAAGRASRPLGAALRGATIFALLLVAPGCIEERLQVEIFTQVNGDGSCTRRIEYRLERTDSDKGGARVPIDPKDDPLRTVYRIPSGDPWLVRDEAELGLHVVTVEAALPSPDAADGDYQRARGRGEPARNYVSFWADPEHGTYDYAEVLKDPASPLAAARVVSRLLMRRDDAYAARVAAALRDEGASPREGDLRRAFRERLAGPFASEVAAIGERPIYGPRERHDLDGLFERLDERQKDLAAALTALAPGVDAERVAKASDEAIDALGQSVLDEVERQGLPLLFPEGASKVHFRATLVMPAPIVRASTCVSGDTAVWEFDGEDLFGRGYEMKALASAP